MKVLVKSTYPQNDGWGKAARDYLKAFTLTGQEIRVQPIILSNLLLKQMPDWIPPRVDNYKPDIFFQQCLPEYFERFPNIKKHVGSCFTETRHLQQTGWIDRLNEMDEIIVATNQEKVNLEESGLTKPTHVVPMPMNFDTLEEGGELDGLGLALNKRFAFYFVGECVERKNIFGLLTAYWREFTKDDDVVLVIKTSLGNMEPTQATQTISQYIKQIRDTLRMYDYPHHYPEVLILTERLSDESMVKLHNTCNCFITLSYGESTCRPLIDAAYRGKPIICTAGIGAVDPDLAISKVNSQESPCTIASPPLKYLYTGWETWMKPDLLHAQKLMRDAYDNKLPSSSPVRIKEKFSYESVARQLNNILQ